MTFKVGDTVRLKSGGPLMTVTTVSANEIWTSWFDDQQMERKAHFPGAACEAEAKARRVAPGAAARPGKLALAGAN